MRTAKVISAKGTGKSGSFFRVGVLSHSRSTEQVSLVFRDALCSSGTVQTKKKGRPESGLPFLNL